MLGGNLGSLLYGDVSVMVCVLCILDVSWARISGVLAEIFGPKQLRMNFVCFTVSPTAKFNIMVTHPCNSYPIHVPRLYSRAGAYRGTHFCLIFALKHKLWVHVRAASWMRFMRRFY